MSFHPIFTRGGRTPARQIILSATLPVLFLCGSITAYAQSYTWVGGGATANWSDTGNWRSGLAPTTAASNILLTFTGSQNLTNFDDIGTLSVNRITFSSDAGAYNISGDALNFQSAGATAPYFNNGGTVLETITDNLSIAGGATLSVYGAANTSLSGLISGTGALTKAESGTLSLGNSANSYSGGTQINAGVLNVASDGALGAAAGGLTTFGGTLQLGSSFDLNSARSLNLANNGTIDTNGFNTTLTQNPTGGGTLTKAGLGMLTLAGTASTYEGSFVVEGGALRASTDSLNNRNIASSRTIEIRQSTSGQYSGSISGTGSLTKSGTGTVTLTGANSLTGGTTVSGGTLAVSKYTYSAAGGSTDTGTLAGDVTVNSGATLTGDGGVIGGKLTVNSGATVQTPRPGFLPLSGSGVLTVNSDAAFAGGSTLRADPGQGSSSRTGQLAVGGTLSKTGAGTITVDTTNVPKERIVRSNSYSLATTGANTLASGDLVNNAALPSGYSSQFLPGKNLALNVLDSNNYLITRPAGVGVSYICPTDWNAGGRVSSTDFATLANNMLYNSTTGQARTIGATLLFDECHSGGMLNDLQTGPTALNSSIKWVGGSTASYKYVSVGDANGSDWNRQIDLGIKADIATGTDRTTLNIVNAARSNDSSGLNNPNRNTSKDDASGDGPHNPQSVSANGGDTLKIGDGQKHYAVLWGGLNDNVGYGPDVDRLYNGLLAKWGSANSNITILFGNGAGDTGTKPGNGTNLSATSPFSWASLAKPATLANLTSAFNNIGSEITTNDSFLFYATDHGSIAPSLTSAPLTVPIAGGGGPAFPAPPGAKGMYDLKFAIASDDFEAIKEDPSTNGEFQISYNNTGLGAGAVEVLFDGHSLGFLDPNAKSGSFLFPDTEAQPSDDLEFLNSGGTPVTINSVNFVPGALGKVDPASGFTTTVPESGTVALFGAGALTFIAVLLRRRRALA